MAHTSGTASQYAHPAYVPPWERPGFQRLGPGRWVLEVLEPKPFAHRGPDKRLMVTGMEPEDWWPGFDYIPARFRREYCDYDITLEETPIGWDHLEAWARQLYRDTRKRAERRGVPFTITQDEFAYRLARTQGKCEVSGVPFDLSRDSNLYRRPFAPSIDRINNANGYTKRNCRVVCVVVNLAMNEWGLDPLVKVALGIAERYAATDANANHGGLRP